MDHDIFNKIVSSLEKSAKLDQMIYYLTHYESNNINLVDAVMILIDVFERKDISFSNSEDVIIYFFLDFINKYDITISDKLSLTLSLKKLNRLLTNQQLAINLGKQRRPCFFCKK